MKNLAIATIAALALLAGCTSQDNGAPQQGAAGSDRDEHGCIGSAGYSWCAKTQECERPWELAKREGIENTAEAFKAFCGE